jgi:predicted GTPase
MSRVSIPNIIVFGETGGGKSSVINMLDGPTQADVSGGGKRVTFSNTRYEKTIQDVKFHVFDTVGLDEAMKGAITPQDALEGLSSLTRQLDPGANLLVYVMRAPRIKATAQLNYKLFCDTICDKQVPVVIVITGLELETDMDAWWHDNQESFTNHDMHFHRAACITSTKGKPSSVNGRPLFESEYIRSKAKVERMFYESYQRTPSKIRSMSWLTSTAVRTHNAWAAILNTNPPAEVVELYNAMKSFANWSDQEGAASSNTIVGTPPSNVIVFGETGVGKTSVINMLDGPGKGKVSNDAIGTTFTHSLYKKTIAGSTFNVFDTVGLNQGMEGHRKPRETIAGLYNLIRKLDGGVHLLVFVVRGRITDTTGPNYELFVNIFCDKRVPVAVVVTGLENEREMERWWFTNKVHFDRNNLLFCGFACITAISGSKNEYRSEYDESKRKVEQLICSSYSRVPWKMPTLSWFASTAVRMRDIFINIGGLNVQEYNAELYNVLHSFQLPEQDIKNLARMMRKTRRTRQD